VPELSSYGDAPVETCCSVFQSTMTTTCCSNELVSEVTQLLRSIDQGDANAAEELLPLVYKDLRKLAAVRMASLAPGQTLQATALVHEAWLRLAGDRQDQQWNSRGHFFSAAAEAMRRILVEKARQKGSLKRGGRFKRIDFDHIDIAMDTDDEVLLLIHEALEKLAAADEQSAKLIQLRFFAGLPNREAADVLGVSESTAKRCWVYARAFLYDEISRESDE